MKNSITTFTFKENSVRVILDETGNPWWVAKDVCDVLDHSNHNMAVQGLDDDEKGVRKVYSLGGEQDTTIISESGLYSLIFRSNKPEAKNFRRWVTHEVLPAIRKTGSYSAEAMEMIFARVENDGLTPSQRIQLLKLAMVMVDKGGYAAGEMDFAGRVSTVHDHLYKAVINDEAVKKSNTTAEREENFNSFILGACVIDPALEITTADLYDEYCAQAEENGFVPIGRNAFFRRIYQTGDIKKFYSHRAKDGCRKHMLRGISLVNVTP